MSMLQRVLSAGLVTALSLTAHAVWGQHRGPSPEDERWFVWVGVGEADYDATLESRADWWGNVNDTGTTFAVGGGYYILPSLGLRLAYEWARDVETANVCPPGAVCPAVLFTQSTDTEAWSLVAVPRWSFAPGWTVFGTAGVVGWRIVPDGVIGRDRGTDTIVGAGIGYVLPSGFELALEYQETAFTPDLDYSAPRLSLRLAF